MSGVGDGLKADNANWNFKGEVARSFDDHVSKSVPLYNESHQLVCNLSDYFMSHGSLCYELGCSTGTLTTKLAKHNSLKPTARFMGIDIEPDMIEIANQKKKDMGLENIEFLVDDVVQATLEQSDLIISNYTIQFIKPAVRQQVFDKIYNSLNWGGAFLLFEKVRANDARFQDIMTGLYNEYKVEQGYSASEILEKSRSLKGVLEPFSTTGNIDLMRRAGFVDIIGVFKYVCFEGFLAIK
jgi:tRNA (cmo5U34)-methyltransferase